MMPLLNHNVGDLRLIGFLQIFTGSPYGHQLSCHHSVELAFTHTISKHNQGLWLLAGNFDLL